MSDTIDEKDLEDSEHWDWDTAERVRPSKQRRVIVSVAFSRDDFQKIAGEARQLGIAVSAFIRTAAIEKASGEVSVAHQWTAGNRGFSAFTRQPDVRTGTAGHSDISLGSQATS